MKETTSINVADEVAQTIIPDFTPNNYKSKNRAYGQSGGNCMGSAMEFYLPEIDRHVCIACDDNGAEVFAPNANSNEHSVDNWEYAYDVSVATISFDCESPRYNIPSNAERWVLMVQEVLAYYIKCAKCLHLSVCWLPDSILKKANPKYLDWLVEQGKRAEIDDGKIVEEIGWQDEL